jgi:hypothetical protein
MPSTSARRTRKMSASAISSPARNCRSPWEKSAVASLSGIHRKSSASWPASLATASASDLGSWNYAQSRSSLKTRTASASWDNSPGRMGVGCGSFMSQLWHDARRWDRGAGVGRWLGVFRP